MDNNNNNNNNNNKKSSPSSSSSSSNTYSPQSWGGQRQEERPITTASEFLERLNQSPINQVRPDAQRKLTSSELLEFLRRQGPEGQLRGSDGNSQSSSTRSQNVHNKERNHNYQTVAIDQCDITSSVDYGSRDYYCPSARSSDAPYTRKENELGDLYNNKTCTDARGNWWEGSFYY